MLQNFHAKAMDDLFQQQKLTTRVRRVTWK